MSADRSRKKASWRSACPATSPWRSRRSPFVAHPAESSNAADTRKTPPPRPQPRRSVTEVPKGGVMLILSPTGGWRCS